MKGIYAVGLAAAEDELTKWVEEIGAHPNSVAVLQAGNFEVDHVAAWLGVPPPPPEIKRVNLFAPEMAEDETPRWLEYRNYGCWTADLVAFRAEVAG